MQDATFILEFPKLQPTLDMLIHKKKGCAQSAVYLPKHFNKRKRYPLCIFLNGFTGGPAHSADSAREVCGDRQWICVNLPLFKQRVSRLKKDNSNYWSRSFIKDADYQAIWSAYRPMLQRIYKELPNIDRERSAMGGFSNGAHTTAVLLNNPHCRIKNFVSHFFFVEGGCYFRRSTALNKTKLLIYQGKEWEKPWLQDACDAARENKQAQVHFELMEGVEHAFPDRYKKKLGRWLNTL